MTTPARVYLRVSHSIERVNERLERAEMKARYSAVSGGCLRNTGACHSQLICIDTNWRKHDDPSSMALCTIRL